MAKDEDWGVSDENYKYFRNNFDISKIEICANTIETHAKTSFLFLKKLR